MKTHILPIDDIIVENRARIDHGDIAELAESIKKLGLLHPLVLTTDMKLLAGERRLRAMQALGWTEAPVTFKSELSPKEQLELELEENTKRKSLDWKEEVTLKEAIANLSPDLPMPELARSTKSSESILRNDLFLARSLKKYPQLAEEKDKSNAYRKARRLEEKEVRAMLVKAESSTSPTLGVPTCSIGNSTLYNIDCMEGITKLPSESIDLVITDFPFGVDLDKNYDFTSKNGWEAVYDDSADTLLSVLLPTLAKEFERVLKPGGHFYIFHPSIHQRAFYDELSKYFTLQKVPLIWHKHTGGTTFAPYSYYMPNYEPIWYGWKGEGRKLTTSSYCVLDKFPNLHGSAKSHPAEKPVELLNYLISQSSIEGETVLDTFSGSGVILEACQRMDRKCIAFELSPHWYELGCTRMMKRGGERSEKKESSEGE